MKVTKDEYELPLAVADSVQKLSEITGDKPNTIFTVIAKGKKGYVKVEVGDDDNELIRIVAEEEMERIERKRKEKQNKNGKAHGKGIAGVTSTSFRNKG